MTRFLAALVTALLAWCGVMQPVQAAVPTTVATAVTCAYDACHHAAVPTCTTTDRGPPAEPYRDIAYPAVGQWSDGAGARSTGAGAQSARTVTAIAHSYDAPAPRARSARAAGSTHRQVQGEGGALSAFGPSRVAANTARAAAEAEAAALRQAGGRLPTARSAAVDRTTGRVFTGTSGESVAVPEALRCRLPDPSLEPWSAANCAEVAACSRAINAGANLDDLITYTVRTRTGEYFPPCRNCQVWLPGGGQ